MRTAGLVLPQCTASIYAGYLACRRRPDSEPCSDRDQSSARWAISPWATSVCVISENGTRCSSNADVLNQEDFQQNRRRQQRQRCCDSTLSSQPVTDEGVGEVTEQQTFRRTRRRSACGLAAAMVGRGSSASGSPLRRRPVRRRRCGDANRQPFTGVPLGSRSDVRQRR